LTIKEDAMPQKQEFGPFVQETLSFLAERFQWDDPYAALAPVYDPDGALLTNIYQLYHADHTPVGAAISLDSWRFGYGRSRIKEAAEKRFPGQKVEVRCHSPCEIEVLVGEEAEHCYAVEELEDGTFDFEQRD
jgi:hypothetical protein